jgi:hypothetical protein
VCDRKKKIKKNLKASKNDQPTTYRYTKHVRTHSLEMVRYISVPRTQTGGFWCVLFLLVFVVCVTTVIWETFCAIVNAKMSVSPMTATPIIKVSASIRTIERL